MDLHCKTCLTSRTGDVLGEKCKTSGCTGTIEEVPAFRTLVDVLPEPMTCGRRFTVDTPGLDRWQKFKSNGNRVCSFCGSLHPDDMFALTKQAANAPEDAPYRSVVDIEPSDKNYKIYVSQPGVRNAHEGGIKFYTHHLPRDADGKTIVSPEQNNDYAVAVRLTRARFNRMMQDDRKPTAS